MMSYITASHAELIGKVALGEEVYKSADESTAGYLYWATQASWPNDKRVGTAYDFTSTLTGKKWSIDYEPDDHGFFGFEG